MFSSAHNVFASVYENKIHFFEIAVYAYQIVVPATSVAAYRLVRRAL